ncbi:GNAT family N-acetyltransferase, partial [Natrinema gari]
PARPALGVIATQERPDGTSVDIGGGLVELLDHDTMVEQLPEGRFERAALAGDLNAMLWFGLVDPAWRGLGIGRALFRKRLEWAQAQGADMVVAWGWERREGRTSRPLFDRYDFVPIQRLPDHYAESRDACPDCGVWPSDDATCEGEAVLWARDLPIDDLAATEGLSR